MNRHKMGNTALATAFCNIALKEVAKIMQARLREFAEAYNLYQKGDRILIAVSGGIDSSVLLHLLAGEDIEAGIVHCNFKLRGEESEEDERFIRSLGARCNIPVHVRSFDTLSYAASQKCSIQEAARDLRYSYFEEVLETEGYDHIAVAHHANDQMETMIFHLMRGTGMAGLHGIKPCRGHIIRPLLFAQREEIRGYADKNGIEFREDSSNHSDKYTRNRIRREIVPAFKAVEPNSVKAFSNTARSVGQQEELLCFFLEDLRSKLLKVNTTSGEVEVPKSEIRRYPHPAEVLYYLVNDLGFSRTMIADILDAEPGRKVESDRYTLYSERAVWVIRTCDSEPEDQSLVIEEPGVYRWHRKRIVAELCNRKDVKFSDRKNVIYADVSFPLNVASWKEGQRIQPLGMRGSRLLSDVFTDAKIPVYRKAEIPVFTSGEEVVWVGGLVQSERYKITEDSGQVIKLFVDSSVLEDGM